MSEKVIRGQDAIQLLESLTVINEENILIFRKVCCVNPSIPCVDCPLGKVRCHEFCEGSLTLRFKKRLANIRKYCLGL